MNETQTNNNSTTTKTKWTDLDHYGFVWIVSLLAFLIAVLVGITDVTFMKLGSIMINIALYNLCFILFVKFFLTRKINVEEKIYNASIALAVFLGLYGVGLAIASHSSLF